MIDGGTQTITIADKLRLQVPPTSPCCARASALAEPELAFEWYERTGRLPVAASKYQRKNPRVLRTPAYAEPRVPGGGARALFEPTKTYVFEAVVYARARPASTTRRP